MSQQIVPFDFKTNDVVAGGSYFADSANEFVGGVSTGFPSLSIKGREFAINRNGEVKTIQRKSEDGDMEPVRSINVVILKGNPHLSKVYYEGKFEEGADTKPTCFSNDGHGPDPDATKPQCDTCAMCPQNQWGSRITDSGKKARACSDSRRLAIAAVDTLDDPMLLRVPATSIKTLAEYAKQLKVRGKSLPEVLTRLSFTPGVAFPSLEFEPKGLLGDEILASVAEVRSGDLVAQIIGMEDAPRPAAPKPAPLPVIEKAEPKPVLTAVVEDDEEDDAGLAAAQAALEEAKAKAKAAKAAKVKAEQAVVEEAPAPAPVARAKPKLEAVVEADDDGLKKSIADALGDDFDDIDL
jgi:hypothetical protein